MAKPLALTSGEPAGIGPDITIKAWLRRNELKLPAFYVLGDPDFLTQRATALGLKTQKENLNQPIWLAIQKYLSEQAP